VSTQSDPSLLERFRELAQRPARDALRGKRLLVEQLGWLRDEWRAERELERVVRRGRTLIVGPWLSEVGYEVLYWVPFLRWVKAAFRLDKERVVAVSRGGVASWYDDIAARYVEVWDELDPAQFAARTAERQSAKQLGESAFDNEVVAAVKTRIGVQEVDVLHPALMFRLFALFWSGQRPMSFLDSHTRFARPPAPPVIDPALLPREYVAVKLYAARSLPDSPETRRVLTALVSALAEHHVVVLLETGLAVDDHSDYQFATGRVISARRWMTPRNNLGAQTQIIARAQAFVGTCGSVTWLAPMLGVSTSALFVDPQWLHAHLPVALRAYHRMNAARFSPVDLRALDQCGAWGLERAWTETS
jgi:hypothetical protein